MSAIACRAARETSNGRLTRQLSSRTVKSARQFRFTHLCTFRVISAHNEKRAERLVTSFIARIYVRIYMRRNDRHKRFPHAIAGIRMSHNMSALFPEQISTSMFGKLHKSATYIRAAAYLHHRRLFTYIRIFSKCSSRCFVTPWPASQTVVSRSAPILLPEYNKHRNI